MKRGLVFISFFVFLVAGCKKSNTVKTHGTVTIDNTIYSTENYYVLGFTFSFDEKVSTLRTPGPDITVDNDGTLGNLLLQSNNYTNSFFKAGTYANESAAVTAFNNLTSPAVPQWVVWADSIKPDQIWVFKTSEEFYAKLRIISVVSEVRNSRNYAECTFEWVFQPDGTLTFPGK